jgi:hypothetical protein
LRSSEEAKGPGAPGSTTGPCHCLAAQTDTGTRPPLYNAAASGETDWLQTNRLHQHHYGGVSTQGEESMGILTEKT